MSIHTLAPPFEPGMSVRLHSGADVGTVADILPSDAGPQILVEWPHGPALHDADQLLRMAITCCYCETPITRGVFCDDRCARLFARQERALDVDR